jgi:hypothetical protein
MALGGAIELASGGGQFGAFVHAEHDAVGAALLWGFGFCAKFHQCS